MTQQQLLASIASESTFDTILQCTAVMPPEMYDKFYELQTEWQNWMLAKAHELNIPIEAVNDAKQW